MKDVCESMILIEKVENKKWKKVIIEKKLIHIDERTRNEVCDTLKHLDILACSLYDLKSADVPTKHFF